MPRDPVAERSECVAFARVPSPFDELDYADPMAAAEHAQGESEGGCRFTLSRASVDDQQPLFDRLAGDLRVLHRLALGHLGAMPFGHALIETVSHYFTFIGMPAMSRTT
jgi:hypothetical protein